MILWEGGKAPVRGNFIVTLGIKRLERKINKDTEMRKQGKRKPFGLTPSELNNKLDQLLIEKKYFDS